MDLSCVCKIESLTALEVQHYDRVVVEHQGNEKREYGTIALLENQMICLFFEKTEQACNLELFSLEYVAEAFIEEITEDDFVRLDLEYNGNRYMLVPLAFYKVMRKTKKTVTEN